MSVSSDPSQTQAGEQKPEAIADHAAGVGRDRLDRTTLDILITAIIAGVEVSLGGIGAMAITGAVLEVAPNWGLYPALALGGLAFPIGFLFVIVGASELFTENFLIPVVAVFNRERSIGSLVHLWGLSWIGNLAGCVVISILLAVPHALGDPILNAFAAYTAAKLAVPLPGVFISALLAGLVMTALTWLLLAVPDALGKMAAIFSAGYLLFAANLAHSIVSAAILLVGFRLIGHGLGEVATWIVVTTAGNLLGGVGLVTLFRLAQVKEKQRQG